MKTFDILVVGGGHAGLEAAYIASQFGLNVAIMTLPDVGLGSAPCNPSVGGVGKGQVVRELDALGGMMGLLADKSAIQYRTLNDSKGFAVQSTRVQIDKMRYSQEAEEFIASISNIEVIRDKVISVKRCKSGFEVLGMQVYQTSKLIMTVGTFLNGKLHTGSEQVPGGRIGHDRSGSLDSIFSEIKTRPQRFKTGTPPRLLKDSVNFSKLEEQPSDDSVRNFHCLHEPSKRYLNQVSCWLARTNDKTMEIIRVNKDLSPMYNGQIKATGARYCPSIEDKAIRYPDKNVHHVFIEPEGINLDTVYPSGISSSLPKNIQDAYVRTIEGLESAQIKVYGYAVEYDVIDTTQLNLTLEHSDFHGLYFAGQVNGTSGYEEAAGQGYVAGVNAALSILEKEPLILSRHDSYIGVMIEDLTSNTRDEPYRLFTARSENRLYIREDNAIQRMCPYRTRLKLDLSIDQYQKRFMAQYELLMKFCDETMVRRDSELFQTLGFKDDDIDSDHILSVSEILRQAWINPVRALADIFEHFQLTISSDLVRTVAISKKYEGYIKRSEDQYSKLRRMDNSQISWSDIIASNNISFECKQRISRIKPQTFGQLRLIDGIRPATLAVVAAKAY